MNHAVQKMQAAVAANLAFKNTHSISNYRLAKVVGCSDSNITTLLKSINPKTVDRITNALAEIAGVPFNPFDL